MSLTLIGLGVTADDVTVSATKKIVSADAVLLKTDMTANYPFFAERGISVSTMDHIYGKSRNFDTLCKNIAAEVYKRSQTHSLPPSGNGSNIRGFESDFRA